MISKNFQRALVKVLNSSLHNHPKFFLNHIKNVFDAKRKLDIDTIYNEGQLVEKTDRVYKPSYPIEFNREGEVLLYSCDTYKHLTVYLKYPYIFYESLIPLAIGMYFFNPFGIPWYWNNINFALAASLWVPRVWYWRSLQYRTQRLSLLRGGRVLKVETQTLSGDRYVSWVETHQSQPLTQDFKNFDDKDNANFLTTEGQLNYDFGVQYHHYTEMGVNAQDIILTFMKNGVVHHPELFEAALKGYNIDTTDFVINTANNLRSREGNHNF